MSRLAELRDTLFIGDRATSEVYNRVFVVSAFAGITNLLLEHKKSGEPGVYALFANDDSNHKWQDALDRVAKAMKAAQSEILTHKGDIQQADAHRNLVGTAAGIGPHACQVACRRARLSVCRQGKRDEKNSLENSHGRSGLAGALAGGNDAFDHA